MGYITTKRILSFKSIIGFGKYEDLPVLQIAQMNPNYLIYIYYHFEVIGFLDNVLDYLKIPKGYRIEKPGKDHEMFEKLGKEVKLKYVQNLTDKERLVRYAKKKGYRNKLKKLNEKASLATYQIRQEGYKTSSLNKK